MLAAQQPQPYQWSVDEFHQLVEQGMFSEDDRIELIAGQLISMAPIGSDHSGHVNQLNHLLAARLAGKVLVAVQNPVILADDSEPQPDITLLRWRDDFYKTVTPKPDDVLLIIEVADTSINYDRDIKVPLYANHNIPEVWLIDLTRQRIESYRKPQQGKYGEVKFYESGSVAAELIPEVNIIVAELFQQP